MQQTLIHINHNMAELNSIDFSQFLTSQNLSLQHFLLFECLRMKSSLCLMRISCNSRKQGKNFANQSRKIRKISSMQKNGKGMTEIKRQDSYRMTITMVLDRHNTRQYSLGNKRAKFNFICQNDGLYSVVSHA